MAASPKSFSAGTKLFEEGEPSTSLFIISKGSVAIRKKKGNAFVEIARLKTNEVLGELSFFDRLPRSATAIALTDVEAIEIDFNSLDKIYAGVPAYIKTIVAALSSRLRRANDTIRRLQKDTVTDDATLNQLDGETESAGADINEVAGILAGSGEFPPKE